MQGNHKQEHKVRYITINNQILQPNNNYQEIKILPQESLTLMGMMIIECKGASFIKHAMRSCFVLGTGNV